MTADEARRQREQLERYLAWVKEEGGQEGPTHLATWFKPHQQARLRWLKSHCAGTVAELGCNWGYALAYCGGHIGVDWNPRTIALARILNPSAEFVEADIRKLPFPDKHMDTVMACDCLEHLPWADIPGVVQELKRVARRRVLITMPNGDHDTEEANSMKHQFLLTGDRQRELRQMFKPGWIVNSQTSQHFFFLMAWPSWRARR